MTSSLTRKLRDFHPCILVLGFTVRLIFEAKLSGRNRIEVKVRQYSKLSNFVKYLKKKFFFGEYFLFSCLISR